MIKGDRIINPQTSTLIYNGRDLSEFGVYCSGVKTFGSAERDYETVEVPGKSGDLLVDKGRFKNVTVPYECFILDNYEKNMQSLRTFLGKSFGYHKLEDSYHPDEYRMAMYAGGLDPETYGLEAGTFDLEFICKPQRFLRTGDVIKIFTEDGIVYNETGMKTEPLLRIYGVGTVTIGSSIFVTKATKNANQQPEYIDLDCDLKDAYYGATNCNSLIELKTGDFPILTEGVNGVGLGEGITKLEITPRWWVL